MDWTWLLLGIWAFLAVESSSAATFVPPTAAECLRAIGPTDTLPPILRRALEPGDDFQIIPAPGPHDWLAEHTEAGQSFDDFVKAKARRPDKQRNKIYLLALGEFAEDRSPPIGKLTAYAAAYFGLEVKVLAAVKLTEWELTTRTNRYTHKRQILTADILRALRGRLPDDGFCLCAVTMEDLYPHPSWNFVFGQASPHNGVGVYSFVRYDPAFYGGERSGRYQDVLLRRSCRVLVHEVGHLFGLEHCTFYRCVMNGSNHLQESDSRPLRVCPVCLRKLQHSIGFDPAKRYRALGDFYREVGMQDEARWIANRLKWITAGE
jgi:archaemetzincin